VLVAAYGKSMPRAGAGNRAPLHRWRETTPSAARSLNTLAETAQSFPTRVEKAAATRIKVAAAPGMSAQGRENAGAETYIDPTGFMA